MYGALVELLPPGSIELILEAHLTNAEQSDLIIVRASILEVYIVSKQPV